MMVKPPSPTTTLVVYSTTLVVVVVVVVVLVVVSHKVTLVEVMLVGPLLHDPDVLLDVHVHVLQLVLWYRQHYPPTPSSAAARE